MSEGSANPFESYAEEAKPAWVRKREALKARRAGEKAAKTSSEIDQDERDVLRRDYRAWKREQLDAVLAGPFGKDVRGLRQFLRTMTASSAPALVKMIERAAWLQDAPADVRSIAFRLVSAAIERVRGNEGLDPCDTDGLPGQPPTACDLVRASLFGPQTVPALGDRL